MTSFDDEPELELLQDPETLHESYVDEAAARDRVEVLRAEIRSASDEIGELAARGELVELLLRSGESDESLNEALNEANAAVDRAEMAGNAAQQHMARLRLAHAHEWRGEFAESTMVLTELLAVASRFGPIIEAFTHQQAGQNDYDQRHFADAREHFARALTIRDELELPDEQRASSRLALAAAERRLNAGPDGASAEPGGAS